MAQVRGAFFFLLKLASWCKAMDASETLHRLEWATVERTYRGNNMIIETLYRSSLHRKLVGNAKKQNLLAFYTLL